MQDIVPIFVDNIFRLIYCIQIEFICNAAFYMLKDGVQKEIERIFYDIEGIFDGFGQPGR